MCGGALLGGCVTRQLPYLWLQEVAQRGDQQRGGVLTTSFRSGLATIKGSQLARLCL